jgi:L,D-transpeptidase catalytic domain/Putative peptidoglycan binding domain
VRSRSFFIAAAVVVLLLVAAGGVYAYDSGRDDTIAKGITVGGVDVGGLKAPVAKERLRTAVLEPLSRPVVARYHGHHYTLTPRRARVAVDIDGSVAEALDRSRAGNILARTARSLEGKPMNEDVNLSISYHKAAIRRMVKRISTRIDRPARDASVDLGNGHVDPTPSANGLAVRAASLRRALRRSLLTPHSSRSVRVRTMVVHPKVTTQQLAEKYPAVVVVNRGAFQLSLYKHLKLAKTYGIAVGRVGLETPAGLYHVQNKAVNPAWTMPNSSWVAPKDRGKVVPGGSPENPLKARWLGIYAGAGIHGTDDSGSIGTAASHGCIRMRIPDVEDLYPQVPVNAPVYIA